MTANMVLVGIGSLELECHCFELRRFVLSEPRDQTDRIPLIQHILTDSRLKGIGGSVEQGSPYYKNMEYLLRKAATALEVLEHELQERK
ncbi:MAG: hypothetical protein ACAH17_02550 [Candidatus Paceibacterota bacterium]